jgi:hypothetical protein
MSDQAATADVPDGDRRKTFAAVVLVEAIVIAALWWFSAHFG